MAVQRSVGMFPNEYTARRLVGGFMLEHIDDWPVIRQYMTLENDAGICDHQSMAPAKIAAL